MKHLLLVISLLSLALPLWAQDDAAEANLPPVVRLIRIYGGGDERLPPVLLVKQRSGLGNPTFGERSITVEIDVQASVPPALYATVVHCSADWKEDNNVFLNDIAFMRSGNISWQAAPPTSRYYTYRGVLTIPNETIKIPYGGNWKVKFFEYSGDTTTYAEARFFALDYQADCSITMYNEFYEPTHKVSPSAFTLEAAVSNSSTLSDLQLHTGVFYRMNRWNEPFVATQGSSFASGGASSSANGRNRLGSRTIVNGMIAVAKRFRLEELPAENDYRIMEMSNTAAFPRSNTPIRLPLSDLRRNGTSFYRADDGAMTTRSISASDDEYVPVEFILDPENRPLIDEDVFVVGSFNNWKASTEWQMSYDENDRLYKLRHWVRRARHNYAYATGRFNIDTQSIENLSYEEFEGNNPSTGHTFLVFVYYRDPQYGGYDSIVAVGAANIFGQVRR